MCQNIDVLHYLTRCTWLVGYRGKAISGRFIGTAKTKSVSL